MDIMVHILYERFNKVTQLRASVSAGTMFLLPSVMFLLLLTATVSTGWRAQTRKCFMNLEPGGVVPSYLSIFLSLSVCLFLCRIGRSSGLVCKDDVLHVADENNVRAVGDSV